MAINDVAGKRVYHVRDILREFLGHNFVSGLCTLKPKKLKAFLKKTYVFPALVRNDEWYLYWGPRTLLELPGISLET